MSLGKAKWVKIIGFAVVLLAAGWGGYAYYQSQVSQPTLYGDWQGQIHLTSTDQTLTVRLRFLEGGRGNASAVSGQLFIQGAPWSAKEQTLTFSGILNKGSSATSVTVVAESVLTEEGLAPAPYLVLKATWEGDQLVEGLVALEAPDTQDTLMGQWQARKVSR